MKKIKIAENFYFSNNSEIKFILGPCQIESKQNIFTRVLLIKLTGRVIKASEVLE